MVDGGTSQAGTFRSREPFIRRIFRTLQTLLQFKVCRNAATVAHKNIVIIIYLLLHHIIMLYIAIVLILCFFFLMVIYKRKKNNLT